MLAKTAFNNVLLLIRYYRKNNLPSSQRLCKYYVGMSHSYSQVMYGLKITPTRTIFDASYFTSYQSRCGPGT